MKCPKCNIEMAITASRNVVVDDNTADKETKLYIEHDLSCRNRNCDNHGKVVKTTRNQLQISKGQ